MLSLSSSTPPRCASWPSWRFKVGAYRYTAQLSTRAILRSIFLVRAFTARAALMPWLSVLIATFLPACEKEQIRVVPRDADAQPYGLSELRAAVDRYGQSDRSPAQYRELALALRELEPRFHEAARTEAERHLVFLALGPLLAVYEQPAQVQRDTLATTVWPIALELEPESGEAPEAYTTRICGGALAIECQRIVPEFHPLVLSALVWERLYDRAREALIACPKCKDDSSYQQAFKTFQDRWNELEKRVAEIRGSAHPSQWPAAGEHAAPWSEALLFSVSPDGVAALQGQTLVAGTWQEALASARASSEVLAVKLSPDASVSLIRAIAKDAKAAGFTTLWLQARSPVYPYPLKVYPLALTGKKRVRVRDTDSIQSLVQALNAHNGATLTL